MTVEWINNVNFNNQLDADKRSILDWLTEAYRLAGLDAATTQNDQLMRAVRDNMRTVSDFTPDTNTGEIEAMIQAYQDGYHYLASNPALGRVHAAPPIGAAIPYIHVSGTTTYPLQAAPADGWTNAQTQARATYASGDDLRTQIDRWKAQFDANESAGLELRAHPTLSHPTWTMTDVRLGNLLPVVQERIRADAARHDLENPPASNPRTDTPGEGGVGKALAGLAFLYMLSQIGKGRRR